MNPKGSVCLSFLLCWHLFMESDYTAQVPPCIKLKQTAAKVILKDQHALEHILDSHCSVCDSQGSITVGSTPQKAVFNAKACLYLYRWLMPR